MPVVIAVVQCVSVRGCCSTVNKGLMSKPVTASLPLFAAEQRRWMVKEPAPQRLLSPSLPSSITPSLIFCHFFPSGLAPFSPSLLLSLCLLPAISLSLCLFVWMNVSHFFSPQTVISRYPLGLFMSLLSLPLELFQNAILAITLLISLYFSRFFSEFVAVQHVFRHVNSLPDSVYFCKVFKNTSVWYSFHTTLW